MVSSDELPTPREELLSDHTLSEMEAGRASLNRSAGQQAFESGLQMLRDRFCKEELVPAAAPLRSMVRRRKFWIEGHVERKALFDSKMVPTKVTIDVLRLDGPTLLEREVLFSHTEEARYFVSEELLTKIILVCG